MVHDHLAFRPKLWYNQHMKILPTTTDVSDLINEIATFVEENPLWADDSEGIQRLSMAWFILTQISSPDMTTQDEYEFMMNIHKTLNEVR